MSLMASVNTDVQGNITVEMNGGMEYENSMPLRKELLELVHEFPKANIILDMGKVDFVGSSGIKLFVETITMLNQDKVRIRLKNVKTEFLKVFRLYTLDESFLTMDAELDFPTPGLNKENY